MTLQIPTKEFIDSLNDKPYMLEYFTNGARFKVLKWHRGSRKTSLFLNHALIEAHKVKALYWIISPYYSQGKQTMWIDPNTYIFRWIPEEYLKTLQVNNTDCSITLPNGSVIKLVGADNPDSLRGPKPRGVYVDEYGEIAKRWGSTLREAIIEPSIRISKGYVHYAGTPKGNTEFEVLVDRGKKKNETWWSSVKTVEDTGIYSPEEIKEMEAGAINKDFFRQEYYCEVISGASSVFKNWRKCLTGTLNQPVYGHQYVAGVDLARTFDKTVITVVDIHTNTLVYFEALENTPWNIQKQKISTVIKAYNNAQTVVDATGVGDSFVQELINAGLPIQAYKISSNQIKRELIERLIMYLDNKYISLPDIDLLSTELDSFEYELTPNGNVTYSAPAGMHDDAVLSLALALTKVPSTPLPFYPHTEYDEAINRGYGLDPRTGYLTV